MIKEIHSGKYIVWDTLEDEILKLNYTGTEKSVQKIILILNSKYNRLRTKEAVQNRAKILGLTNKLKWKIEEDAILKINYNGTKNNIITMQNIIKTQLNKERSIYSIRRRASQLGLTKYTSKGWNSKDEQKLTELVGLYSTREISKILKRTERAVRNKCFLLNLKTGAENRHHWYNIGDLERIFGVQILRIKRWIDSGYLKFDYFNDKCKYKFMPHHLKDFICKYPLELTGRNLDMVQIIEILCGDNS